MTALSLAGVAVGHSGDQSRKFYTPVRECFVAQANLKFVKALGPGTPSARTERSVRLSLK